MRPSGKKSKGVQTISILAISLAVIVAALVLLSLWQKQQWDWSDGDSVQTITYEGKEYVLRDNVETLLVIGLDKLSEDADPDSYNNDMQADFLSLLILDKDEDTVTSLQINRDTMAEMNILGVDGESVATKYAQIGLSHAYGDGKKDSCKNTVKAVSGLLYSTPIDHYVSVTMDAVSELNDMLGGVEVTVLDEFKGAGTDLVKGETVLLDGKQALTYVRARSDVGDETNESRMRRQRQYLDALYKKLVKTISEDKLFISKVGIKLSKYMVSDCTLLQLERIASFISKHNTGNVAEIAGESKIGEQYVEFYPDESALKKQIIELFYEPA